MQHFAIIGHPIGHSLSPLMHTTGFTLLRIDAQYTAIDVLPESLGDILYQFRHDRISGFNVTVPHKQTVMQYLDFISQEAKEIGAVNTVHYRDGKFYGYNTDVLGVQQSLEPFREKIQGQTSLVFGAGGSARSVMYALTRNFRSKKIFIIARSLEKAAGLANAFYTPDIEIQVLPAGSPDTIQAIHNSSLLVNCTPLGMYPNIDASPMPDNAELHIGQIIFDLIYRPMETRFLQQAQTAHATTIGGLQMLVQQGAAAFKLWTGHELPLSAIQAQLLKALSQE